MSFYSYKQVAVYFMIRTVTFTARIQAEIRKTYDAGGGNSAYRGEDVEVKANLRPHRIAAVAGVTKPAMMLSYFLTGPVQAMILICSRSLTPEGKIKIKSRGEDSLKTLSDTVLWGEG